MAKNKKYIPSKEEIEMETMTEKRLSLAYLMSEIESEYKD
jgi:hypothetical protein